MKNLIVSLLTIFGAFGLSASDSVLDSTETVESLLPAPGDSVILPILVGYGDDGGIDTSSTEVVFEAGASGADSLFIYVMNAGYEANEFSSDKRTFIEASPTSTANHNRRDDGACVRFKVNAGAYGSWVCDWNDHADVDIPYREREPRGGTGGISGWYSNVRVTFDIPTLNAGDQLTAEFSWNGTDGRRSGYRIFDVDLIDNTAGDGELASVKVMRNPEAFVGYSAHADSIAAGRAAWFARNTLEDFGAGGVYDNIIASCQDCHQNEGSDLRRFNYEPEVITSRGRFHNLSTATSRNITSYIMSLDVNPNAGYDYDADGTIEGFESNRKTYFNCRPWNPPFQPGPGLDRLPVGEWICGAGYDAFVEYDYQMAEDLFPTGFHPDSIAAYYGGVPGFEREFAINRREMRMSHQLRVWNGWLPQVSLPDMTVNWNTYCESQNSLCWETGDLGSRDHEFGRWFQQKNTPTKLANAITTQRNWFRHASGGVTYDPYLRQNGVTFPTVKPLYADPGFWRTIGLQSLGFTLGVRLFDVMTNKTNHSWNNEYGVPETAWEINNDTHCSIPNTPGFEHTWADGTILVGPTAPGTVTGMYANTSVSSALNPSFSNRVTCAEWRGGNPSQQDWTYFAMSTHIMARDNRVPAWDYSAQNGPAISEARNGFEGSIWYELAALLETGNRWSNPGSPNDWNYSNPHTNGAHLEGGSTAMQNVAMGLSMLQVMMGPNRLPTTIDNWKGWYPHHAFQQGWLRRDPTQWNIFASQIGGTNAKNIFVGLTQAWLEQAERYNKADFDLTTRGPEYGNLDAASTVFDADDAFTGMFEWQTPGQFLLSWARVLHDMDAPDYVTDRMARYGGSLFNTPSYFTTYYCNPASPTPGNGCVDSPPPPPSNQAPTADITFPAHKETVGVSFTALGEVSDIDGTVVDVQWNLIDIFGTVTLDVCPSATPLDLDCELSDLDEGEWYLTLLAEDDDGAESVLAQRQFIVDDGEVIDTTIPMAVTGFEKTSSTATSITMQWNPGEDTGCATPPCIIDHYEMQLSAPGAETWIDVDMDIQTTIYEITALAPYSNYDIRIRSEDESGNEGPWIKTTEGTLLTSSVWAGTGSVDLDEASLTLYSTNGGRLWGSSFGGVNACTPVSGDFTAYVTLKSVSSSDLYSGAALIATEDDSDGSAASQGILSQFSGTRAVVYTKPDGSGAHSRASRTIRIPSTFRLVRSGGNITYSVAVGLGSFSTLHTRAVVGNPTSVCVLGSSRASNFTFVFSHPTVID